MPTTRTIVVAPSGGDYTSLAAAEAAEKGDIVASDEIVRFECHSMGAGVGDAAVTFGSWVTDATRYVEVVAIDKHEGAWDSSKYFITANNSRAVYNGGGCRNLRFIGVQFRVINTSGSASNIGFWCDSGTWTGANIHIIDCISYVTQSGGTSAQLRGISISSIVPGVVIENTLIIVDNVTGAIGLNMSGSSNPASAALIRNTTIRGGATGFVGPSNSNASLRPKVKNVGVDGATTGFSGSFHANSTNNASNDTTAPGSNQRHSVTPTFVATNTAELDEADTAWKDQGTDLSADGDRALTTDIIGTTRSGTWDIGAFELVASGGGGSSIAVPHFLSRKRRYR